MKDKVFSKNNIFIIVIICLILLLGIIFICVKNKNSIKASNYEAQISDLELQISSLNSEKEELSNKITDLNNQITTLTQTVSTDETTINELKENINNLSTQKEQINSQISSLKKQVDALKQELNIEKETYIVFYSVNNKVIYQEKVRKGQNVKSIPSSPIDGTTITWEHDGKNVQSDMVIHGTIYCTLSFESDTNSEGDNYAILSTNSIQVPYNTVIQFTPTQILIDNQEVVNYENNSDVISYIDDEAGWGIMEDGEITAKASGTYKVTSSETFFAYYGGCILKGTKITMSDGTTKNVEDLVPGDKLLSYDFFEGGMVEKELIGILKGTSEITNVITIQLENGSTLKIADLEYVFDADDKKYYFVNKGSSSGLVGKNIIINQNGNREVSKVISVSVEQESTEHYTLFIEDSSNYIASNILTRSYTYWLNDYFTFTDDYKIDLEQLEEDISSYGLYTYDEVKDYVSYDIFEKMNLKYAKFVSGKGIASNDYVLETLGMLEYEIVEGNKRFNK